MTVVNTNIKSLVAANAMAVNERNLQNAMTQLSTGSRINSARDDAAGLAISSKMTAQINGLNQAVRNAGDAISLIQTAEGATNEITDMMTRMRELAVQAVNDTNSNPDRSFLDLEFQQLKQEIVRVSETTEWNGFKVLNGTAGERVGEAAGAEVLLEHDDRAPVQPGEESGGGEPAHPGADDDDVGVLIHGVRCPRFHSRN